MHYSRGQILGYDRLFRIVIALKFRGEEVFNILIVNELENVVKSDNLIAMKLVLKEKSEIVIWKKLTVKKNLTLLLLRK